MPQLQEFATPEQREAAWKAHVQRTTDRIRQYRGKLDRLTLEDKPETLGERLEIEEQVKKWEEQLRPQPAAPSTSAVETLKAQVAALTAQVSTLIKQVLDPPTPPPASPITPESTTNGEAHG